LQAGLETAEYIHTDDTGARHQGQNGYCTVIGNDLFAHFSSTKSKSRENYLRILRGPSEDFVLNEYSCCYLEQQQLATCHLSKLKFSNEVISQGDQEWSEYLEALGITSQQGIKLGTEAALLGSAIEHGLSPEMIILCDGAKQFAIDLRLPSRNIGSDRHRCGLTLVSVRRAASAGTRCVAGTKSSLGASAVTTAIRASWRSRHSNEANWLNVSVIHLSSIF